MKRWRRLLGRVCKRRGKKKKIVEKINIGLRKKRV